MDQGKQITQTSTFFTYNVALWKSRFDLGSKNHKKILSDNINIIEP